MAPILRKIAAFFGGSSPRTGKREKRRPTRSPSRSSSALSGNGSVKGSSRKALVRLKSWFERTKKQAPEGFFSVDVGRDKIRYVIPIDYLSNEDLQKLLDESVEEFGHSYVGALQLACEEDELMEVLNSINAVRDQGTADNTTTTTTQEESQHLIGTTATK